LEYQPLRARAMSPWRHRAEKRLFPQRGTCPAARLAPSAIAVLDRHPDLDLAQLRHAAAECRIIVASPGSVWETGEQRSWITGSRHYVIHFPIPSSPVGPFRGPPFCASSCLFCVLRIERGPQAGTLRVLVGGSSPIPTVVDPKWLVVCLSSDIFSSGRGLPKASGFLLSTRIAEFAARSPVRPLKSCLDRSHLSAQPTWNAFLSDTVQKSSE
jgi:hypothetical protein